MQDRCNFTKFEGLICERTHDTMQLHFQRSLSYTLTCSETFYLPTETETVSRMEKAGPLDCCCSHHSQWHRRLFACVRAHGGHFDCILSRFRGSVC